MKRVQTATTFRHDEVQAACQLFALLLRGADASQVLRSEATTRVVSKFQRMKQKLEAQPRKEAPDG